MVVGQYTKCLVDRQRQGADLPFITGRGPIYAFAHKMEIGLEKMLLHGSEKWGCIKLDFVKCDGHVGRCAQFLALNVRLRLHHSCTHKALLAYYRSIGSVAVQLEKHGELVLNGQRMSGSPETSADNSLITFAVIMDAC
jgi:hypothetical protein